MKDILFKNVVKKYNDEVILKDISFSIKPGISFGIIGPNGAGKTTILKILAGYTKFESGEIRNLNHNKIGISFGGENGFYKEANIYDNLYFFACLEKIKGKMNRKRRVEEVLKITNLSLIKSKKFGDLSLGMKQRMHIARALLNDPDVLLLDEPTNGLDLENSKDVRKEIIKITQKNKIVVITSHNLNEIEKVCEEIILLNKGEKIFQGAPLDIITLIPEEYRKKIKNLEEACEYIYEGFKNDF